MLFLSDYKLLVPKGMLIIISTTNDWEPFLIKIFN